ncbi:MAG TPA: outer membrane protein transport protein [Casimicrobiaceae bacterium]|nr:outer membrane protein transport protein [Casimicrobiaceae bacterium]
MKSRALRRTRVAAAVGAALLSAAAGQALGAAFALQEQNASGLGHAYAGGAAAAEDVSTIFYNPAGLVRLQTTQAVVAANVICPSAKFHDSGSQPAAFQPLGGTGGDAGDCAIVPNLYLGIPFTDKWSFGIGVNVPFGLKTEYDSDWLGRFQAVKSKLDTVNINPVLSWEPTPHLTVGGGVSWQRVKATLTSQVNFAGAFAQGVGGLVAAGQLPAAAAPVLIGSAAGLESGADVSGSDSSWGWDFGALWQANDQTRFGVHYRSKIKYDVSGSVNFSNPSASSLGPLPANLAPVGAAVVNGVNAVLASGDVNLHIEMPDTANVSVFHQFNNQWDLMADLQYTGWSTIKDLTIVRSTGVVLSSTPENFRDTWRISGGANYRYSDRWTFRGGVAYDQSPVRDAERTPRLPDNDRTWLAVGVQYRYSPSLSFDLAYAYIWVRDPNINQNEGNTAANGLINGSYRSNVNIVGLQLTYTAK